MQNPLKEFELQLASKTTKWIENALPKIGQCPEDLWHFTRYDGLRKIVDSKQFRLTAVTKLGSEHKEGFALQEALKKKARELGAQYEDMFSKIFDNDGKPVVPLSNWYAGSFTRECNNEHMWKHYAPHMDGGVAIRFNSSKLFDCIRRNPSDRKIEEKPKYPFLLPVSYNANDQYNFAEKFIKEICNLWRNELFKEIDEKEKSEIIKNQIKAIDILFKTESYRQEDEIRILLNDLNSNEDYSYFPLKYVDDSLKEFPLFTEIMIGPSPDQSEIKKSVKDLLTGWGDVKITRSLL